MSPSVLSSTRPRSQCRPQTGAANQPSLHFTARGGAMRVFAARQGGYWSLSLRMQLIIFSISMVSLVVLAAGFSWQSNSSNRAALSAAAVVNTKISALRDTQQVLGDYRFRLIDSSAQRVAEQAALEAQGGVAAPELRRWREQAQRRMAAGSQRLGEQVDEIAAFAPSATAVIRQELPRLQALELDAVASLVRGDVQRSYERIAESAALLDRIDSELASVAARLNIESRAVAERSDQRAALAAQKLMAIVALAIVVATILTILILRRNIPALRKTVGALKAFGRNEYDVELPPVGDHELGEIALGLRQFRDTAQRLAYLAETDSLTGLANRYRLEQDAESVVSRLRSGEHSAALLFIDIDRFKAINDALGHAAGDKFLQEAARRLRRALPTSRLIARTTGDQFAVLLFAQGGIDEIRTQAAVTVRAIHEALDEPYRLEEQPVDMSAGIGIALAPYHGWTSLELMRNAESAMYAAKRRGAAQHRFYTRDLTEHIQENLRIASDLRAAMRNGDLQVYFQPIVHADTGQPAGAEALLRWTHRTMGVMSPARFVPVAEETQTIVELGEWVLQVVCQQIRQWQDAGLPVLPVAVNIGARHFADEALIDNLRRCLHQTSVDPSLIELEITESAVVQDPLRSIDVMSKLRAMGVRLSLDDFGTGYSSLAHLQRFPLNKLKIDQSFVSRILNDSDSDTIVSATISMGHELGLTIVAEGAESAETVKRLEHHHCDLIQGYFVSRAMPPDAFSEWLLASVHDKVAAMRSEASAGTARWPVSSGARQDAGSRSS